MTDADAGALTAASAHTGERMARADEWYATQRAALKADATLYAVRAAYRSAPRAPEGVASELVARLRKPRKIISHLSTCECCGCDGAERTEAAARIEADAARIERLEALLRERDEFIVSRDLWSDFTDTIPRTALGD